MTEKYLQMNNRKIFLLLFFIGCWSLSQAQQFDIVSKSSNGNQAIINTQQGKWTFSTFPGNIIKTTFIAVNSIKNENISDAVIAKPLTQ